jgi:branched-chain amino acid transport system permease protein
MTPEIAAILAQDGIVNGAIYATLALCLVLVFAVTRIVLIPQGEFVAFGALTYATLAEGRVPASLVLLVALAVTAFLLGVINGEGRQGQFLSLVLRTLLAPTIAVVGCLLLAPLRQGPWVDAALAVATVAPMAPLIYRVAFQPLADASTLVLLIAAVGVHLALTGLGLLAFGAEGLRGPALSSGAIGLGPLSISAQQIWVVASSIMLMVALALYFATTLGGRALRATAINRVGARLVGIETAVAGRRAFTMAGLIGAASGVLLSPLTTVYYDSGFLIGLKGFVAAIFAGMAAYPVAVAASLGVGLVESFAAFWASPFKEAIVFATIIPVLVWRSLAAGATEEDDA